MTDISVEFFTDPFSPWCWQCEPLTRKLRFKFGRNFEWIPRMTVSFTDSGCADPFSTETDDDSVEGHRWADSVDGPHLPVVGSLWEDNPPDSSRTACQVVASVRERHPGKAERLLRHMRESTFVAGNPPETVPEIEELVKQSGLDISWSTDDRPLLADIGRAREVAAELDQGVAVTGAVETVEVGPPGEEPSDEPTVMIAPPCLRLERDERVVVVSPRGGYASLENAVRTLEPALQSSRVGHMEQIIDSVASRTTREIAEEFGKESIKSNTKEYLKLFERAFLAEISFGVDASQKKTSRILFQLEEASIIEPIYGDELAAWRWKGPGG